MRDDSNKHDELLMRWANSDDLDERARGQAELERRKRKREDETFRKLERTARWSAIAAVALAIISGVELILRLV